MRAVLPLRPNWVSQLSGWNRPPFWSSIVTSLTPEPLATYTLSWLEWL